MQLCMQCGYSADEIYSLLKKYSKKIKYVDTKNILKLIFGVLIKQKIIIDGFNSGEILEKLIRNEGLKKNIINIKDIRFPLIIPSVDLYSGNIYCFISQSKRKDISNNVIYVNDIEIGKAVRASCSYPLIFSPCKYKNIYLVDGGIRENIPWKQMKEMGADKVMSVVFEKNIKEKKENNIIDIISNSINILNEELSAYEKNGIDYLINIKTPQISLLDMNKINELYQLGYDSTKEQIKKIKL